MSFLNTISFGGGGGGVGGCGGGGGKRRGSSSCDLYFYDHPSLSRFFIFDRR